MHWAPLRDRHQTPALRLVEISLESDLHLYLVEHSRLGFAISAILGVHAVVSQANLDCAQRPSFRLRIHAECYGRSRTERAEKPLVRTGAAVGTSDRFGLVRQKSMVSGVHRLGIAVANERAYENV